MKRLPLLVLPLLLIACDNPVEPSSVEEDNPISITNIINVIDGDDGCTSTAGRTATTATGVRTRRTRPRS